MSTRSELSDSHVNVLDVTFVILSSDALHFELLLTRREGGGEGGPGKVDAVCFQV